MRPNQRVTVELVNTDPPRRYYSRIEGIDRQHILLAAPLEKAVPLTLPAGMPLRVTLFHKTGVHAFNTVVVGREMAEIPVIRVARPTRLEAVQRRQFFRQSVVVRTLCRVTEEEVIEGYTRDVGGGGFCLRTNAMRAVRKLLNDGGHDEPLWVEICMPDEPIKALAALRWWNLDDVEGRAELGFEFIDIDEAQRERVIRYLLNRQREALKKGR